MASDLRKRALDAVPIRIPNAADHRVIFLNQKFPSADRQVAKDEAAAMTCETQFCVEHHVRLFEPILKCSLSDLVLQRTTLPV